MKAIVIAAGEGSRMGNLTQNIPKSLVVVNGKSIIERQLSILKQNGILDIIKSLVHITKNLILKKLDIFVMKIF